MSSHPTYDPNTLDETWETLRQDERAPLLNRATQGLFPVGDLARLVGLIGLHDAGLHIPADPLAAPLSEMMAPLGQPGYLATAHQLGLTRPLAALPSQPGRLPNFEENETVRELAVTPLHLARVTAALELAGRLPNPTLSLTSNSVSPASAVSQAQQAMKPTTAGFVRSLLPPIDSRRQIIGLTGQATPEETGQAWLSWFVGLAPAETGSIPADGPAMLPLDPGQAPPAPTPTPRMEWEKARYVVVTVVVTNGPDREAALRVARAPLNVLLEQ
jgi:hypothetical protein